MMSDTLSFIKDEIASNAPVDTINDVHDGCLVTGRGFNTENTSEFQVGITIIYQATIINFTSFIHK